METIPRGIEVLIKKAAVDVAFRQRLLEERSEAAQAIGLTLTPAEVAMLDVASDEQLRATIDHTRVEPRLRPAFLGRAAAVMLAALGACQCTEQVPATDGIRPDPPPKEAPAKPERKKPAASTKTTQDPQPRGITMYGVMVEPRDRPRPEVKQPVIIAGLILREGKDVEPKDNQPEEPKND